MIVSCNLLKSAINNYLYENNLKLKDTHIYIDSAISSLFINEFKIYGNAIKPDYLISNAIKPLIFKFAANQVLKLDNLRNEIEKHAPYRKQTFIDVSKGNDFFIKYKIELFAM